MQLWTGTLSPFSAKVRMTMREMGIDCAFNDLPWNRETRWEPKPDAFLAVSPRGEVPVLVVDGEAIFDSTIINEYLCEAFPDRSLMPDAPAARARCRMHEDNADHLLAGAIVTLISEVFLKPDGVGRDVAAAADANAAIARYQQGLDIALANQDHVCGDFSVADIAAFVAIGFAATLGSPIPESMPALHNWWQRMNSRPAISEDFAQMMRAAAAA